MLPWQEWLFIHGLELKEDGNYRFRTVVVLVSRQCGKTTALMVLSLWRLVMDQAQLVLGTSTNLDYAREAWQKAVNLAWGPPGTKTFDGVPELDGLFLPPRYANGEQTLSTVDGARYKIGTAGRTGGRSLSIDLAIMDELREHKTWDAWSAASKATNARPRGQRWALSNMGDASSIVLNHFQDRARKSIAEGTTEGDSLALFEWSAPEGCDVHDRSAWVQAVPALGYTISEDTVADDATNDPEPVFRTEVLCQRVESLTPKPFTVADWDKCEIEPTDMHGDPVLSVDMAPGRGRAAIAAAARAEDGRPLVWIVAECETPAELVETVTREALRRPGAQWVGAAGSAIESIAPALRDVGVVVKMLPPRDVAAACGLLQDHVADGTLAHLGDPILSRAIEGAARKDVGDGAWIWTRRKSDVDISALYAVTLAHWDVATSPGPSQVF